MKKERKYYNKKSHKGNVLFTKGKYNVIDCTECELKHIMPLIEAEDQEEFYSEKFYVSNFLLQHVIFFL